MLQPLEAPRWPAAPASPRWCEIRSGGRAALDQKWAALTKYESQLELNRPYFTREFVESIARVRGLQVKAAWAEAFELIRIVL